MRIVFLVESAAQIWGGVKVVLEDANGLADRSHRVTVLCKSPPPAWMEMRCEFRTVQDFAPEQVPAADVVVGTFWTTVPDAVRAAGRPGAGVPVHFCQGYEGDNPENARVRDRIEEVYRTPVRKITISPHLTRMLAERFDCDPRPVAYGIDHRFMFPGQERARDPGKPVRVGLVGPYQIAWKDIPTGIEACDLAHRAGLELQLVRITNTAPHADEQDLPFPVEWHVQVPPRGMGDLYRSMDVFLGTSRGAEEGFFLPAVEAMACGVPCVLTDVPCFRGHGAGQYALFAEPGEVTQLAEALVIVGKHPEVADRLRREGIRIAAQYTADNHVADLERALAEIATSAPAAAPAAAPASAGPAEPASSELSDQLRELTASLVTSLGTAAGLYRQDGRFDEARQHLQAAVSLRPDDAELRAELARAHYLAGHDDQALEIYSDLLRSADDSELHADRAMVLFSLGEYARAAQGFAEAIRGGTESPELLNNLGVAQCEAGDREAARRSFERVLALEPSHADASTNLQALTS